MAPFLAWLGASQAAVRITGAPRDGAAPAVNAQVLIQPLHHHFSRFRVVGGVFGE
jgi:hypothetical protein